MTAWHSQHPHSVTGAGSRSHCLPLMSMSLMEMEESEGHISIQIASILSAIQLPGSGGCRFPSAAPLTRFHRFIPIAYKSAPCGSGPMPRHSPHMHKRSPTSSDPPKLKWVFGGSASSDPPKIKSSPSSLFFELLKYHYQKLAICNPGNGRCYLFKL